MEERLPDGLVLELARDKCARQRFSMLSSRERDCIVARARAARTRAELRLVVLSLSDREEAREYF